MQFWYVLLHFPRSFDQKSQAISKLVKSKHHNCKSPIAMGGKMASPVALPIGAGFEIESLKNAETDTCGTYKQLSSH